MSRHVMGTTVTTNGSFPTTNGVSWLGTRDSRGTFAVQGTIGTATVTPEASADEGVTWDPISNTTFIATGFQNFQLFSDPLTPMRIRMTVSGAGGTDVDLTLFNEDKQ